MENSKNTNFFGQNLKKLWRKLLRSGSIPTNSSSQTVTELLKRNTKSRVSLDEIMMGLAFMLASRSHDPKRKVGCVITDKHREKVLGMGYNGGARGLSNERDSMEKGSSGFVHAEANALVKCDYSHPDKVMFLTLSPCKVCAKLIVNARVSEVYYAEIYDYMPLRILDKAGIKHGTFKR